MYIAPQIISDIHCDCSNINICQSIVCASVGAKVHNRQRPQEPEIKNIIIVKY